MAKNLPQIPEFDVREILAPGVSLDQEVTSASINRYDIISQMEQFLRPRPEVLQFMDTLHRFFLGQCAVPLEESWASEAGLTEIYEVWREFVQNELANDNLVDHRQAAEYLAQFDKVIWPLQVRPLLEKNAGLAAWSRRFATGSLTAFKFVQNVHSGRLAEAMCMAHCNGWDVFGRFGNVPLRDSVISSCLGEECFMMARDRCRFFQRYLDRSPRVLYLGGGCDPTLRMNGYVIPVGQSIDICDAMDCRAALETALERPLDGCRINFRVEDLRTTLSRTELTGKYDLVIASGLMSYCRNDLGQLLPQVKRVLTQNGIFVFDLQVKMLDYLYVAKVHHWPTSTMVLEESCHDALHAMSDLAEQQRFSAFESWYDPQCQSAICFAMHK